MIIPFKTFRTSLPISMIFLLVALFGVGLAGCKSDDDDSSAAVCNALVNDGPSVTSTIVHDDAPVPAGGTLKAGTYTLSAFTFFGDEAITAGLGTVTEQEVIQVSGSTLQTVQLSKGVETRFTATFSTSGSTLSSTETCPDTDQGSIEFTATDTELRLYVTTSSVTAEATFTKR